MNEAEHSAATATAKLRKYLVSLGNTPASTAYLLEHRGFPGEPAGLRLADGPELVKFLAGKQVKVAARLEQAELWQSRAHKALGIAGIPGVGTG